MDNYKNLTDAELVKVFVNGDKASFEEILERHRKRVYTYIYLIVRKEQLAEDIFQDTFIKVINSLKRGKYKDNGKFVSWVLRIAHNLIIDHFRKEKQLNTISNDSYEADLFNSSKFTDKTVEEDLVSTQITKDVRNIVQQLPYDQSEVVILRHYCDFSFKEIAEHTNVSINTALGRMRYALINLRRLIKENNLNLSAS